MHSNNEAILQIVFNLF